MGDASLGSVDGGFAERLLEVIDAGRRTATYKLALLLALLDLCAVKCGADGRPPRVIYTREIAEQVAALYWPQVAPYQGIGSDGRLDLRQIRSSRSTVIEAVRSFRRAAEHHGATFLHLARQRLPESYEAMLDEVERTIANEPLPRLQTVGSTETEIPFIYVFEVRARSKVGLARLHRDDPRGLPVRLLPGAGDQLVRLSPLIRPLVELHWTRMVAHLNGIARDEELLHSHLFGSRRLVPPPVLRASIGDLQGGRCFYCERPLPGSTEIDHFIPRVRCGIDVIENLVLADRACNNDKRDLLASPSHVATWAERNQDHADALAGLGSECGWGSDATGTLAVARSIYGHLPDQSPFWAGVKQVRIGDRSAAMVALAGAR